MSDTIKTTRLEGNELVIETKCGTEVYDGKFLVAALLIYVAKGSGTIEPEEVAKMIELGRTLSDKQKEDIAVMALKVIAADGRRQVSEMEQFNRAVEAVDVAPEIVHRAFDRYFEETMPGK